MANKCTFYVNRVTVDSAYETFTLNGKTAFWLRYFLGSKKIKSIVDSWLNCLKLTFMMFYIVVL